MSEALASAVTALAIAAPWIASTVGLYLEITKMSHAIGRLEGKVEMLCKERGINNEQ